MTIPTCHTHARGRCPSPEMVCPQCVRTRFTPGETGTACFTLYLVLLQGWLLRQGYTLLHPPGTLDRLPKVRNRSVTHTDACATVHPGPGQEASYVAHQTMRMWYTVVRTPIALPTSRYIDSSGAHLYITTSHAQTLHTKPWNSQSSCSRYADYQNQSHGHAFMTVLHKHLNRYSSLNDHTYCRPHAKGHPQPRRAHSLQTPQELSDWCSCLVRWCGSSHDSDDCPDEWLLLNGTPSDGGISPRNPHTHVALGNTKWTTSDQTLSQASEVLRSGRPLHSRYVRLPHLENKAP